MDAIDWVRTFFEQQLAGVEEIRHLYPGAGVSTQHFIAYLVDQTVRRAVLDAAGHGEGYGFPARNAGDVSWKRCLMVAAFAELRSVKLLARKM